MDEGGGATRGDILLGAILAAIHDGTGQRYVCRAYADGELEAPSRVDSFFHSTVRDAGQGTDGGAESSKETEKKREKDGGSKKELATEMTGMPGRSTRTTRTATRIADRRSASRTRYGSRHDSSEDSGLEGDEYDTGGNTERAGTVGRNGTNNPRAGQRVRMRETHQRLTPMGEDEGRRRAATASWNGRAAVPTWTEGASSTTPRRRTRATIEDFPIPRIR